MKNLKLAIPVLGMLALGGCATTTPANITSTIQQVQQTAVAICGFLPTAATVANVISGGNPLVVTVDAIAQAICAAVAPMSRLGMHRRGAAMPTVNGVVIHGRFVR